MIYIFLSRLRDSGIIFQLNSNIVIVKPDLSRCLKLILCHNFSKMMYICNCIVHVSRHIMLFLLSLQIVCIHVFFLFPCIEHPAGWICARYKSLLLLLYYLGPVSLLWCPIITLHKGCELFLAFCGTVGVNTGSSNLEVCGCNTIT